MNTISRPLVILLVEDEKTDAYLIKWALKQCGIMADVRHVSDGREALNYLHRNIPRFADAPRPELIMLDLNMPCMGGQECLANIKQDPSMADIPVVVLSTSYAKSDVFGSCDLGASDYFAKPMDIQQLVTAICSIGERWISPGTAGKPPMNLGNTLKLVKKLPDMPKIAREILSIELSTDEGNDLLLKLVKEDPAILARVTGMANSPLFCAAKKIETVDAAASVLGLNRIKMIALCSTIISCMDRKPPGVFDTTYIWLHSMAITLALDELSNAMPPERRPGKEDIYLAGLLHDIGFLVLGYIDPDLSNRFHTARLNAKRWRPVTEFEAELLEMNHSELGALLAEHWELPETIVAVLRNHHSSNVAPDAVGQPIIAMIKLAEKLAPPFSRPGYTPPGIDAGEWLALGIAADRADEVGAAIREHARDAVSAMAENSPG